MPASPIWSIDSSLWPVLTGYLCVAARIGGALLLVPIPGLRSAPAPARIVLLMAFSVAAYPLLGPHFVPPSSWSAFLVLLAAEMAVGIGAGALVGLLNEVFSFAMQSLAMQAGYAYASSIDPNTQADSGILPVIAQLASNLLFFSLGFHLLVLRAFALSLERVPPGAVLLTQADAAVIIQTSAAMLEFGLRLALPVMGVLLLTDLTLALLGRIQPNLQLLTLIFPVKMLGALLMLAMLTPILPRLYRSAGELTMEALMKVLK